jgi:hypothetical protein
MLPKLQIYVFDSMVLPVCAVFSMLIEEGGWSEVVQLEGQEQQSREPGYTS